MRKTPPAALADSANCEELFDWARTYDHGNHVWDKRELIDYFNAAPAESDERAVACCGPSTCNRTCPAMASTRDHRERRGVRVIDLQGCVFMNTTNDPFHAIQRSVARHQSQGHRGGLSRRGHQREGAMGWHLDGKVTAVLGTHTHIPTADERVLPNGTAYRPTWHERPLRQLIGVEKSWYCANSYRNAQQVRCARENPRCAPRW